MDKKRIFIAILFFLACIGIGYLLYRVFFYKAPVKVPSKSGVTNTQGQFPESGEGQISTGGEITTGQLPVSSGSPEITGQQAGQGQQLISKEKQIVDVAITSPAKDTLGQARYYNQTDGKFYHLVNGQPKALSDQVFYNVQKANWSNVKDEAILEYPDGNKIYYNFNTKKQATLPKHWEEFSFSPLGDKIAAKSVGLSTENRWMITSDPDRKNISLIESMGDNADKVAVAWSPNKQVIATSRTGEELGDDRQEVLFVGLHGENFKSTIIEGRDFRSQWSPEGKKLLYSVHSTRTDYKPELWIVNAEGDNIGSGRQMLSLNTWADKCNFSGERYVYCAVPSTLDAGVGFAPQMADNTPDNVYRIDLQTGLKTIIPMNDYHTISSLFTSNDGKTLYFTDKTQSGLFSLPL